jgi:hypothetical protein
VCNNRLSDTLPSGRHHGGQQVVKQLSKDSAFCCGMLQPYITSLLIPVCVCCRAPHTQDATLSVCQPSLHMPTAYGLCLALDVIHTIIVMQLLPPHVSASWLPVAGSPARQDPGSQKKQTQHAGACHPLAGCLSCKIIILHISCIHNLSYTAVVPSLIKPCYWLSEMLATLDGCEV